MTESKGLGRHPNMGGLSLEFKLNESMILTIEGKEVILTVYETHKGSARINVKAPPEVRIERSSYRKKKASEGQA